MAIEFKPAAPMNAAVAEQFGRTEQFNKFAPLQASMYEADARNRTAASIATAENQTRASATSAELQGRKQFQDSEMENAREMQRQQFFAAREMQQRAIQGRLQEQQMENDRFNMQITKAEEMQYVQEQNGLAELDKMRAEESIDPETYRGLRFQLQSKVKYFENKRANQQAKALEQATQMEQKAYDNNQKNAAMAKHFAKAQGGAELMELVNPQTGEMDIFDFDPEKKTWQKIGVRNPKAEKEPQTEDQKWQESMTTKGGQFDFGAAEKRTEKMVQYDPDYKHLKGDEEATKKFIEQNVQGMYQLWQEGKNGPQQGQKAPVTAPSGQNDQSSPKAQAQSQLTALQQQYPDPSKAPPAVQQQMRQLYQQYKSQ